MKQTLRIFAKDVRRFLPEILLSLAVLALLVYAYPQQWIRRAQGQPDMFEMSGFRMNINALIHDVPFLVPIAWSLLIARLIHAEALTGDRQFWVTRPYEWKKLLAAKVLFLAVFLYLPFIASQLLILHVAGLDPLATMPSTLFDVAMLTGLVILPLIAISAVTSSIVSTIGIQVAVLIAAVVFVVVQQTPQSFRLPGGTLVPLACCVAAVCIAVVLMQYAFRRTLLSRAVLIGAPVLLGLVSLLFPSQKSYEDARFARDYPLQPAESAPLQLSIDESEPGWPRAIVDSGRSITHLYFNLRVSAMAADRAVAMDRWVVSLDTMDGFHWETTPNMDWRPFVSSDSKERSMGFEMPRAVYERVKSKPVALRVILYLTELGSPQTTQVLFPSTARPVPGLGVCRAIDARRGDLICRSAYQPPHYVTTTMNGSSQPCESEDAELHLYYPENWALPVDGIRDGIGIAPISFSMTGLTEDLPYGPKEKSYCTGQTLTARQFKPIRQMKTVYTFSNFNFPGPWKRDPRNLHPAPQPASCASAPAQTKVADSRAAHREAASASGH